MIYLFYLRICKTGSELKIWWNKPAGGSIKGTISDQKNLQIFQKQRKIPVNHYRYHFTPRKWHKFDKNTVFHQNLFSGPWPLCSVSLLGKISLNFETKFHAFLQMKQIKPHKWQYYIFQKWAMLSQNWKKCTKLNKIKI